jgi:hypothetical protein
MTNKPKRKRAPGGGRKSTGPFSGKHSTLSTRITIETRRQLEEATARRRALRVAPWSLSQEIETRLRASLALPEKLKKAQRELEEAWGAPHLRALAQLILRLARNIESGAGAETDANLRWNRDPYTHQAVTTAIAALLAHYKPAGEVRIPANIARWAEWARAAGEEQVDLQQKPESLGLGCVRGLLAQMSVPLSDGREVVLSPHIEDILKELEQ